VTAQRGLLRYVFGLAALLLGAEVSARVFERQLAAAADRSAF
jgi:hypothetical protein